MPMIHVQALGRTLVQSAVLGFSSFWRLPGSPLKHAAGHPCTLHHSSHQAGGVVVLDPEHVVQGDGAQNVEPHVRPSNSEVTPALAVVFKLVSMCKRSGKIVNKHETYRFRWMRGIGRHSAIDSIGIPELLLGYTVVPEQLASTETYIGRRSDQKGG